MAITQHPNGRYRAEIYYKGFRAKGPLRRLKSEAKTDERRLELELKDKVDNPPPPPELTLGRWVDEYMAHARGWAANTVQRYQYGWSKVPEWFKQMPLAKIDSITYRRAMSEIESKHYQQSAHTLLGTALDQALLSNKILSSPARSAKIGNAKSDPVVPPNREQVLTVIEEASEDWQTFIHSVATTGLRRQEMCGLQWVDLMMNPDPSLRVRQVVWETDHGLGLKEPKEKASLRTISVDERTMEMLQAMPRRSPFVFAGDWGNGHRRPTVATKYFERLVKSIGFTFSLHDLRHYHASTLIAAGVDIKTVSARLGHSNPMTTLKVYSHLMSPTDRVAADAAAL